MESLIETLRSFDTSLIEGCGNALKERMSYYDNNWLQFNKDIYTISINSDEKIQALVAQILEHLKVPEQQRSRYLGASITVNELFIELRDHEASKNKKIDEFIGLINQQVRARLKKVVYGSVIIFAALEASSPVLAASGGFTALQGLIAAAAFLPLVGILYTTAAAIYSIYQNATDKKIPFFHRLQRNLFLFAQTAIKLTGYCILAAAATTSTPVVAALFVAAAAVVVVGEVASLVRMSLKERHHHVALDSAPLQERQAQARHAVDYIKRRNDRLINIAAAVIGVAIVAVSCFVPGGIFVTLGVVAAVTALYFVEQWALKRNKAVMDARLHRQFEEIEEAHDSEKLNTLQKANTPTDGIGLVSKVELSVVKQEAPESIAPMHRTIDDQLSHPSQGGFFSVNAKSTSLEKIHSAKLSDSSLVVVREERKLEA